MMAKSKGLRPRHQARKQYHFVRERPQSALIGWLKFFFVLMLRIGFVFCCLMAAFHLSGFINASNTFVSAGKVVGQAPTLKQSSDYLVSHIGSRFCDDARYGTYCLEQITMDFAPNMAPPPVGDLKNKFYQLEVDQTWPHKTGIVFRQFDQARFAPGQHPWPATLSSGDLIRNLMSEKAMLTTHGKGARSNPYAADDWCIMDHTMARNRPSTRRYHIDGIAVNKDYCSKGNAAIFQYMKNGIAVLDGLRYKAAPTTPQFVEFRGKFAQGDTRALKFLAYIDVANPLDIQPHRVEVQLPSADIVANHQVPVTFNILNSTQEQITTGGIEAMVSISWNHKTYEDISKSRVNSTQFHLISPRLTKLNNNDEVIFAPFNENGSLTLNVGVQEAAQVDMTVTLKRLRGTGQPIGPYGPGENLICGPGLSTAVCKSRYAGIDFVGNSLSSTTVFSLDSKPQTLHPTNPLRLVNPDKIKDKQWIFLPIEGPAQVEIVDKDGKRIVSGSYANLKVKAVALLRGLPLTDFLSVDADFELKKGLGVFGGSLIKIDKDISLKFQVEINGRVYSTASTKTFTLSRHVGSLIDRRYDAKGKSYDEYLHMLSNENMYLDTMKNFIPDGNYLDFPVEVMNRAETTYKTEYIEDNEKDKGKKIDENIVKAKLQNTKKLVVLGSTDQNTQLFASKAAVNDLILISDASTSDEFIDKTRYPNLVRLAFTDSYRYATMANFLTKRNWNHAVIIHGDKGVPETLAAKLNLFGIRFYSIVFPRNAKLGRPTEDQLTDFFTQVKDSHIKIVISLLEEQDLEYLIDGVVTTLQKDQISTTNGYTWIFDGSLSDPLLRNPFDTRNDKRISTADVTTNLQPFKGAFIIRSYYEHFNLDSAGKHQACRGVRVNYRPELCDKSGYEPNMLPAMMLHDARFLYWETLIRLQLKKKPVTPTSFLEELRNFGVPENWATTYGQEKMASYKGPLRNTIGYGITFDEKWDRMNYTAQLLQLADRPNQAQEYVQAKRLLILGDTVTANNIKKDNILKEVKYQQPLKTGKIMEIQYSSSPNNVNIKIPSAPVHIDPESRIWPNTAAQDSLESVPLAYFCQGGCGGNRLNTSIWDGRYENGRCVWDLGTKCVCNQGYEGIRCEVPKCPKCNLQNGNCDSPGVCSCKSGYKDNTRTGTKCDIPHCDNVTSTFSAVKGCKTNVTGTTCLGGNRCQCAANYYGPACRGQCSCTNGICDDGDQGTGTCDCTGTGYFGESCSLNTTAVVVGSVLSLLAFMIALGLLGRHRLKQIVDHNFLMSTDWRANWFEIKIRQTNQRSSQKSMQSMISMISGMASKKDTNKLVCTRQGVWNGRDVVYKLIRKDKVDLSVELRAEVKIVREMAHPNIALFVGACIDAPNICILNEVCAKGSLEDILNNEDFNFDWDFKWSMMKDIARGMTYIGNSPVESHGRLKSSNCLVDSRWCVKLADFGFQQLKAGQHGVSPYQPIDDSGQPLLRTAKQQEGSDFFNLLWTAPELLATGVTHLDHVGGGSIRGDIYSMAMIMTEMCSHSHPFHELQHLNPQQIINYVSRIVDMEPSLQKTECRDLDNIPIYVLRPEFNDDNLPPNPDQAAGLRTLIETCWNQDKFMRPDFNTIMKCLNRICPHSGELMDGLIKLMEAYTASLECIVSQRTASIVEEKAKGDDLLNKMLPPLIAEELKSGKNPQPEFFKSVTIYFSDIIGFGALTAECTPLQVVAILNHLYETMDGVIDGHDVYKVETIGDCYMVASGLPIRNGDRHAGEICNMSLELLQAFNGVSYSGYENRQVQLRVGIHSGPCVAGVVGTKMPRYCLFGDTVNTASRMESGGFALRIHMSSDTHDILETLGGYISDCRGEIAVKGRGTMRTYWLQGREGVSYDLPGEELALSASQHYFK